jgi:hypothetical protein
MIGWDHWLKGRWSMEWATLIKFDIKNNNSDIKHVTPEELILQTWEYIHDSWTKRNKIEHEEAGSPEMRRKAKLIKIILGTMEFTQ